ncbi:MAG TPA: AMP-binding protein, partial [Chloroflexaceae bacterium]|nr:AMP-binding protein [Chloroflexaceae bacterium]
MSDIPFGDVWLAPLSPRAFLARSARVFAGRTAVVYGERRATYAELDERARRLAAALRALGVGPGDRVAFLCPNTPPLLEAHFACPILGAVLVAVNTRLSSDEVAYILDHSGAKVACVDTALAHLVDPHLDPLPAL